MLNALMGMGLSVEFSRPGEEVARARDAHPPSIPTPQNGAKDQRRRMVCREGGGERQ